MKIVAVDYEVRNTIISFLTRRKYSFHTFTPKNEQSINLVIKSLPNIEEYNADVIASELAEHDFFALLLKPITSFKNREPDMIVWHVAFAPNTNIANLVKIKAIANHRVKIELFKKKPVVQCHRCQRFHHSASNCHHAYRCVKCAETHDYGNCKLSTNQKPKCANCEGDHTANNLNECAAFKKIIKDGKFFKNAAPSKININNNNAATSNRMQSYSSVVRGAEKKGGSKTNTSRTSQQQTVDNISKQIFAKLAEMIQSLIAPNGF